jgi:hypothetical protein
MAPVAAESPHGGQEEERYVSASPNPFLLPEPTSCPRELAWNDYSHI